MSYTPYMRNQAQMLISAIMKPEPTIDPRKFLGHMDRDQVYSLKWIFEQAIAVVENEFEERAEV